MHSHLVAIAADEAHKHWRPLAEEQLVDRLVNLLMVKRWGVRLLQELLCSDECGPRGGHIGVLHRGRGALHQRLVQHLRLGQLSWQWRSSNCTGTCCS